MKAVPTLDLSEFDAPPGRAGAPRTALDVDMSDIDPPPAVKEGPPPRMIGPLEDEWYVHDKGELVLERGKRSPRRAGDPRWVVSPLQEHSGVQGDGPLPREEAEGLVRRLEMVRETMEK